MASKKRIKTSFAVSAKIPHISRPRRSCCSYVSSSTRKQNLDGQSPHQNNLLIDLQNQNEGRLRVKSNFATPTPVLPAAGNHRTPQCADDGGQSTRVYRKCREKERTNLKVTSSCPPLGRGSVKSQHKTGGSSEAKNLSKNFEDSLTPESSGHDQNEISLSGNDTCRKNLKIPFQFPVDSEDTNLQNTWVQSMQQRSDSRSVKKASSSCPPLGMAVCKRSTGERCTNVRTILPLGSMDDLPGYGIPKMRAQKWRNSVPVYKGKYSLPETFVRVQRAHFAEVDAFVLQEDD